MKSVKLKLKLADGSSVESSSFVVPTKSDLDKKQDCLPIGNEGQFLSSTGIDGGFEWKTLDISYLEAILYEDLKNLKAENKLVPGKFYRLTDYVCTTTQENTSSAKHSFDIILLALDINQLSERAWAAHNTADSYFAYNNLEAWQVWYCLENDTLRFNWADTENGKGVIYRLIDEFNNDCPYDFKNIIFEYQYSISTLVPMSCYTFSNADNSDASINLDGICHNNIIKRYHSEDSHKKAILNNNIVRRNKGGDLSSTARLGAHGIIFDEDSYNNTIVANNCAQVHFKHSCHNNFIEVEECMNNTIGMNCAYNILNIEHCDLGDGCTYNEIYAKHTTLGNNCSSNRLGSLGHPVWYSTVAHNCAENFVSDDSYNIYLGNSCKAIKLLTNNNIIIPRGKNITVDPACSYIRILTEDESPLYLQNIHIHSGINGTLAEHKEIIFPSRDLSYTTEVFSSGSTELFI